jgi:hypothetical protein
MPKAVLFLAAILAARAQTLHGVIDVQVHCDPDGIFLAKLARSRGMRAIVLKNHYEPTASLAWLARQAAPGLEIYGGITLNRSVGGFNPAAVEYMAQAKGGLGRFVWMPTVDAPHLAISKDGRLVPEVLRVLDLIAKHRLVLASGNSTPEETLLLIKSARARGIRRVVVTQPMLTGMTIDQMRRAAVMGAFIEFDYNSLLAQGSAEVIQQYAAAIRACGTAHVIVASDLGQSDSTLPPDGLLAFYKILRRQGFTPAEIERMARSNPAKLLLRY